jgi:hypothetical protein
MMGRFAGQFWVCKEAKHPQTVIHRDKDDTPAREILSIIINSTRTAEISTARNPNHNRFS